MRIETVLFAKVPPALSMLTVHGRYEISIWGWMNEWMKFFKAWVIILFRIIHIKDIKKRMLTKIAWKQEYNFCFFHSFMLLPPLYFTSSKTLLIVSAGDKEITLQREGIQRSPYLAETNMKINLVPATHRLLRQQNIFSDCSSCAKCLIT